MGYDVKKTDVIDFEQEKLDRSWRDHGGYIIRLTNEELEAANSIKEKAKSILIENGYFDEAYYKNKLYLTGIVFDYNENFNINVLGETLANSIMEIYRDDKIFISECILYPHPSGSSAFEILINV